MGAYIRNFMVSFLGQKILQWEGWITAFFIFNFFEALPWDAIVLNEGVQWNDQNIGWYG